MKVVTVMMIASLSVTLFAETVTKNSVPFSFPPTSGTINGAAFFGNNVSLGYRSGSGVASNAILLSWTLPAALPGKGTLSLFNVAGIKVKSFPIASLQGMVKWDAIAAGKHAKGVYCASLSCGTFKKNIKIIVY